ncbi:hypothetical protein VKT23_005925 [Stygiomarasmius scandens]|uniref:Uncharacterized protein n=1 Tax=Marasmiellus scandens TaxID=2682957 RepID=A0ABR1JRD0_9AGAR
MSTAQSNPPLEDSATEPTSTAPSNPVEPSIGVQATSTDTERHRTIILALPIDDTATEFRHAVVPLPNTYLDAIESATRVYSDLIIDPTPEHIVLRQLTKNKKTEWVWADIDPANWKTLVSNKDQIGVFKRRGILENFLHGKVFISFGYKTMGRPTTWTDVTDRRGEIHEYTIVDRPTSYQINLTTFSRVFFN